MKKLIIDKLSSHLGSAMENKEDFLQPATAQNIIIKKKDTNVFE